MTRKRYDEHGTPFSNWLRTMYQRAIGSHTYSCQNLDFIWHNYRESWLITIEEKRFGGMRNGMAAKAQRDTHGIIEQMLQQSSGTIVRTMRGKRKAEYRGHYEIVFTDELPENGMSINGNPATVQDLLRLLTTGDMTNAAPF